jgi:ParB family chromosome partitioning protein
MPKKAAEKTKPEIVKSQDEEVQIAVTLVPIEKIDDNPFNTRQSYPEDAIKEMAESIRDFGLRQVPTGRPTPDGRVQLAFGHMRLRGFRYGLEKITPPGGDVTFWKTFPVLLKVMTDEQMLDYAMEENLTRTDVTPIEVARAVEAYSEAHPDVKDKDIAKKHHMSEANVSNMKRVLRLPEKFLQMVDEGKLSFTQGRELLTLEKLPRAEDLMTEAVEGLQIPGAQQNLFRLSLANTVDNLQKNIHRVIQEHYLKIDNQSAPFDVITAGCLKCEKCITTHPSKNVTVEFCVDVECWNKKAAEFQNAPKAQAPPATEKPENISQEMFHEGETTQKAGETTVQTTEKAPPTEGKKKEKAVKPETATTEAVVEHPVTQAAAEVSKTPKVYRKVLIEEKPGKVSVSIASPALFSEDVPGTLEDAIAKLPELLVKAAAVK